MRVPFRCCCQTRLFNGIEGFRRGDDFVVFFGDFYVIGTGFDSDFHDLVFISLVAGDDEEARVVEHPADAARSTEVAAGFGEFVANVGSGAVAVIREDVDRNGNACRTVAFIYDFFVVLAFRSTGTFWIARLMLSFGMLFSFAFWRANFRRILPTGSGPPMRTAMVISRPILVVILPRMASFFPFYV